MKEGDDNLNSYEIINNAEEEVKEAEDLPKLLEYALSYLHLQNVLFNIIFVTREEIHRINKEYRGVDRETDVISFALEDDDTFVKTEVRVLGDIYICYEKAKEQAVSYGHSLQREVSFLTIHGLLHLLGYDHMTKEDEEKMFGLQELILDGFGIRRE